MLYQKKFKHHITTGSIYGSFEVLSSDPIRIKSGYAYKVKCSCGNILIKPVSELVRNFRKGCKKCCGVKGEKNHLWKGFGQVPYTYYSQIKHGAESRNILFNLTIENISNIFEKQEGKCALSSQPISFKFHTASLDRIDSEEGYNISNVQFIHKDINLMKNDLDEDYFLVLCSLIAKKFDKDIKNIVNNY